MLSVIWSGRPSMRALSSWANLMRNSLSLCSNFCTISILCGWKFNDSRAQTKVLLHYQNLFGWKFHDSRAQTKRVFFILNKKNDLWIKSWGLLSKCSFIVTNSSRVTAVFRPDFLDVVIQLIFTNFICHFLNVVTFGDAFLNFVQNSLWILSLNEVQNDRWSPEYSILTGHCCCCCCSMTIR